MRFSRYMLALLVAASVVCLALIVIPARCQGASNTDNGSSSNRHRYLSGIFDLFASPLRATMKQARRLIENQIDSAINHLDQIQLEAFKIFMSVYKKSYLPEEIPRRMALFVKRRKEIEQSARDFVERRLPFKMRENVFMDWDESELKALAGVVPPESLSELTPEEREALSDMGKNTRQVEYRIDDHTGVDRTTVSNTQDLSGAYNEFKSKTEVSSDKLTANDGEGLNLTVRARKYFTEQIPEYISASVDWRRTGCVSTPIRQINCAACYAIASMSIIETMACLNGQSAPTLSAQQIVDCSDDNSGYENHGCSGGWPTKVMNYLRDTGLAARESCYSFVDRHDRCNLDRIRSRPGCTVRVNPSGRKKLRYKVLHDESDILYHVGKYGPVLTTMQITNKLKFYGEGIFDDPTCGNGHEDMDHGVVIVGYGREKGVDYWLIKNSWGTGWGQGGYGKIRRGKNACSIGLVGWAIIS